jgi:hypothetical protein
MQRRSILDCAGATMAFELDDTSADKARAAVSAVLRSVHASEHEIDILLEAWIRSGNYLLEAPTLPRADYVIGNPPYIRLEDMDDEAGRIYRATYRTMVGRADIYIAFFEAALRQLAPGGVCAFICADRWMLNQYGAQLRRFITASFAVEAVVEMHHAAAFESDVSAYPAVIVIRRDKQGPVVVAQAGEAAEATGTPALIGSIRSVQNSTNDIAERPGLKVTRVANWFHGDEPWSRASPEQLALLKHLECSFSPLEAEETGTKVGIGVATGLDDVFITTETTGIEESRLLPLAMASDVTSGQLRWSGHYLVNPWTPDGLVDLTMFPKLRSYYAWHQERLMKRHVAKQRPRQWYRTIDRVNHQLTGRHKLYFPDIKNVITPVLDDGHTYPHHNLYYVISDTWDMEVLGGLLMSAVGQFFVASYGVRMRGGYLRFQAQYLRRIRVPSIGDMTDRQADALRIAFRQRDVTMATNVALDVYRISALPIETYGR